MQLRDFRRIRPLISNTAAITLANSFIHSRLDYCNSLFYGLPNYSEIVDFSSYDVFNALRGAKRSNSSGPDNIPSLFWVILAGALTFPISIIFYFILQPYCHMTRNAHWFCHYVKKEMLVSYLIIGLYL